MKENRLYTLLQSHRKIGITLFWVVAIFFGCFCFPLVNFTKTLSDMQKQIRIWNIFISLFAYVEVGLLSGYLFEKKKIGVVLLINAAHIVAGMICRYFLEFGEVSNTYNFTPPQYSISHYNNFVCLPVQLPTHKEANRKKQGGLNQ